MNTKLTSMTCLGAALSLITGVAISACSDDDLMPNSSNFDGSISFSASVQNAVIASRAPGAHHYMSFKSKKFDNANLYLIGEEEYGIDPAMLGSKATALVDTANVKTIFSRGVLVNNDNLSTTHKLIKVFGYSFEPQTYGSYEEAYEKNGARRLIDGEVLHQSSDEVNVWTCDDSYYWSNEDYDYEFVAVSPAEISDQTVLAEGETSSTEYAVGSVDCWPYVRYVVPSDPLKQIDLLYALTPCTGKQEHVAFSFKHALTAIQFKSSTESVKKITKVAFTNLYMGGKLEPCAEEVEWTHTDYSLTNCSLEFTNGQTATDSDGDGIYDLITGDNTLLMMPQKLQGASKMTITYIDASGNTKEASLSLSLIDWKPGTTITYLISNSDEITTYYLSTNDSELYFGHTTGSSSTNVHSYKLLQTTADPDGTATAMSWTAEILTGDDYNYVIKKADEVTKIHTPLTSAWTYLTSTESSGNGTGAKPGSDGFETDVNKLTVYNTAIDGTDANGNAYVSPDAAKVRKMASVGSESAPYDLSKTGGTGNMTAANCYIINGPGTYKVPLTYGPTVINNVGQTAPYSGFGSATYQLNDFPEHIYYYIPSTWISSTWQSYSGYKVTGARVEWQDVPNLITDIKLSDPSNGTPSYITFTVPDTINNPNLRPGNALISVFDDHSKQRSLWSYHIWLTPYKFDGSDDIVCDNYAGGTTTMAPVPLGYVEENYFYYPERHGVCRLTQKDADGNVTKTVDVQLVQKVHTYTPKTCTYYQWGRKDPFPGSTYEETGSMQADGSYEFTTSKMKSLTIGKSVTATVKSGVVTNTENTHRNITNGYDPIRFTIHNQSSGDSRYSLCDGICNPNEFLSYKISGSNADHWYDYNWGEYGKETGPWFNLWGSTSNSESAGLTNYKTIFDPSPRGYRVPAIYQMPKLTCDGRNYTNGLSTQFTPSEDQNIASETDLFNNYLNTPQSSHETILNTFGMEFYTAKMSAKGSSNKNPNGKDGKNTTIFFPLMGFLDRNNKASSNMGQVFYYWTATAVLNGLYTSSSYEYKYYYLYGGYVKETTTVQQAYGKWNTNAMPIWPIRY